jgi:hypothetical protein
LIFILHKALTGATQLRYKPRNENPDRSS